MLPGATGQLSSGTLLLSEENAAAGCRLTTWFGGVRKRTEAVEKLFSRVRNATVIRQTVETRKKDSDCHHLRFHYCVAGLTPRLFQQPQLFSVQANATSVSRGLARPQKGIFKGVFHTADFGLRTRRWMSGYGYERKFWGPLIFVRFPPQSRHTGAQCPLPGL